MMSSIKKVGILIAAVVGVLLFIPQTAEAHSIYKFRPHMGPVITYYNGAPKYERQMRNVQRSLNASGAKIILKKVSSPTNANIVIKYQRKYSCRRAGQTGLGGANGHGKGFVHLAPDCTGYAAQINIAHEIGHAIGLNHENRVCATMNESFIIKGSKAYPKKCSFKDWYKQPYTRDDLNGVRARYGNKAPVAVMNLPVVQIDAQGYILPMDNSTDADGNIVLRTIDWGDGNTESYVQKPFTIWPQWMGYHQYEHGGVYTITLTIKDSYGVTTSAQKTVTVIGLPDLPDPDLPLPNLPLPDLPLPL